MSRPHRALDGAPATARAALPETEAAAFDRLAHAVLARPGAALGATLRAVLPGPAGPRWLSLYRCCAEAGRAPVLGAPAGRGGRPTSAHGHASGAHAIPRWGQ